MDFEDTLKISSSGMAAQSLRLRTIAENLANADSTSTSAAGDPYRRKVITFKNVLDKASGVGTVQVGRVAQDASPFEMRYMPGHPAADANGYVKMPNVNTMVEIADMREAQRSYEANVDVIDIAKNMLSNAMNILR